MYDDVTKGTLLTEKGIELRNRNIYNDSLYVAPTNEVNQKGEKLWKVVAPFDPNTNGIISTNTIEALTDRQRVYQAGVVLEIPTQETFYIYAYVPPDKNIKMTPRTTIISSGGGASQPTRSRTRLYYDGEAIGGTLIQKFNKDHNAPDTLNFDLYNLEAVTPTNLGTELPLGRYLTAEVGSTRVEGERSGFVMKKDSVYILSVENLSTNVDLRCQLYWEFYESDI